MIPLVGLLLSVTDIRSSHDLGKIQGRCRAGESGPAFLVRVEGLKDRRGLLKLELYPANDSDFLADDDILLRAGKAFARVEIPVPQSGPVELCIRAPRPGRYGLSLLHDRDSNHKFSLTVDGAGFSDNPKLGWFKPKAAAVAMRVGDSPVHLRIIMNYHHGLMSFGPVAG
jgi:uncharacterized protein (DUF2141 family)|uniref:DUF2141 domain-containing protein n=1 Tax=Sphingomonas sp. TaxID=28214 RepID=UPI0025CF0F0C|nr:DUF2141 domain-containing protein [Sphingomonas sp.]